MKYDEIKKDLFSVDFKEYTPAHCISSDCKMGAGIAVPMKKKFHLENMKEDVEKWLLKPGHCIYYNEVYNLITKEKYWHKPTYNMLGRTLTGMRLHSESNSINKIVMPKIGSGLDKLSWPEVRKIIEEIFNDLEIEILVCKK